MRASEASEKKFAHFHSIRFRSFVPLNFKDFFLAEHKIRRTRTICTFVGVPRTRVRHTEYSLKRSESGVPKRGGIASCMDSSWKNSRHVFFFFLELSPLVKLRPFEKIEMKFCKCHISKSIKDRNLKRVSAERG